MSTTHRVLSPAPGSGARFSVPFFQGVAPGAEFDELNDSRQWRGSREGSGMDQGVEKGRWSPGMVAGWMMWSLHLGEVELPKDVG